MKTPILFLWALAAASPGAGEAPAEQVDADVLVTRVTPDPEIGSGFLGMAVGFSGTVGGEDRSYFIPFMGTGQAKPHVGEHCAVTWIWQSRAQWHLGDGTDLWEGRAVTRFSCRK
jgi:hypothetical protein